MPLPYGDAIRVQELHPYFIARLPGRVHSIKSTIERQKIVVSRKCKSTIAYNFHTKVSCCINIINVRVAYANWLKDIRVEMLFMENNNLAFLRVKFKAKFAKKISTQRD